MRYVFGPVPSRRLGRSLGVDLVPLKTCSYDCLYCQAGRTTCKSAVPAAYHPVEDVLRELDGKKPVLAVSRSLQIPMNTLREVLNHLHRMNLIEVVQGSREVVDRGFFQQLESRLADVMGPMAGVLIRDEVENMGEEAARFPKERTGELIDRLAAKIFVESKKQAFLSSMKSV